MTQFFNKVLVANRGEIALRIMSTLKKMNITSVAIYSEADTNALHVSYADEAYFVGNSPATESYLSIKNVINAVRVSGADAVHPGYGFLSENPNFAIALKREGVTLIGPSSLAIKQMGDKIEAKKIAENAKVTTIPGFIGTINYGEAVRKIERIGFPVIVKAAAGGGGRGIRVVHNIETLASALESARLEAQNSFNDSRVFIEKFIQNPRHIEIQVLADQYGNIVCLGERECSIQNHYQKIIEEAPSIFVGSKMRKKMFKQSEALVKKVGYYSAGTIEFIVDRHENFFFLEMNTRLQVEHTVTELITGIDIVEEMIKIAAGQKLSFSQNDITFQGHAIECRIYAEDPSRGFLPSSGRIINMQEPLKDKNIRIDSGIQAGSEVSMFYDAMIAKLCTYGKDRVEAMNKMKSALSTFVIDGISHNISFLEAIFSHDKFIRGDITTDFIEQEYSKGFSGAKLTFEMTENFLATAIHIFITNQIRLINKELNNVVDNIGTRWVVKIDNKFFFVIIKSVESGYNIRYANNRLAIRSNWNLGNKLFSGMVNGRKIYMKIENMDTSYTLTHAGISTKVNVRSPRIAELESLLPNIAEEDDDDELLAPLTGSIININIKEGDIVEKGQDLMVLTAMKLENIITAPYKAKIQTIHVKEHSLINSGDVLITFEKNFAEKKNK